MTDPDANRFAPPRADVSETSDPAGARELAGRGSRLAAVFLDGILGWMICMPVLWLLGRGSMWHVDPGTGHAPLDALGAMLRNLLPAYLVLAVVQAWSLHAFSGTLGKKLLGLRIVRSDGRRAGFARLFFGRGGSAVLPVFIPILGSLYGLVDTLLIFRDSRQCLHDQIADTIVVKSAPAPAAVRV